jgi:hypothetical protein
MRENYFTKGIVAWTEVYLIKTKSLVLDFSSAFSHLPIVFLGYEQDDHEKSKIREYYPM